MGGTDQRERGREKSLLNRDPRYTAVKKTPRYVAFVCLDGTKQRPPNAATVCAFRQHAGARGVTFNTAGLILIAKTAGGNSTKKGASGEGIKWAEPGEVN